MKFLRIFIISLLCLGLAGVLIGYILFRRADTEKYTLDEPARKQAPGNFVRLSDGITHFELAGPDTGRVVVFMHGFSVPYYIWDSNFYALASAGFRVLRFDAFGRGYSDRPDKPYEAALYRKQIAELLAALKIHSVQAMAGVSFGGPVVTDFAVHYPRLVQSLILVDPLLPGFGRMPDPEFWKQFNTALDPEQMVNGQLSDLKYPKRFPDWTNQYRVQMQYKGFRRALISTRYHYAPDDTVMANYRALDALGKPVLLIWGREDITVPFRFSDTLQRILHTEFMPVDESAHLPQMEKPALINQKIISFLRRQHPEHPVLKP